MRNLGLAIVQGIVGTHDGALTEESHPGQGTTFALYLPQLAPPTTPARRPWSGCRRPPIDGTWTENLPHDPPHGGTTPDAAGVAAVDDRARGAGQTEPDDFTRGRWDADRPHCHHGRDQSSPCLQVGGAVSASWPGGAGR